MASHYPTSAKRLRVPPWCCVELPVAKPLSYCALCSQLKREKHTKIAKKNTEFPKILKSLFSLAAVVCTVIVPIVASKYTKHSTKTE